MKKENKKQKIERERELKESPINVFSCCGKSFPAKDFKEHLINDHKLLPDQMKGTKKMIMHLDGDYWFSSTYEWEFESGLKFTQYVEMARADDDMMRYG